MSIDTEQLLRALAEMQSKIEKLELENSQFREVLKKHDKKIDKIFSMQCEILETAKLANQHKEEQQFTIRPR